MSGAGIRLVAGLGNPGERYAATRHNVGFWFVEELAARAATTFSAQAKLHGALARVTLAGHELRLLKPDTYMNHSGRAVAATANYYRIPVEAVLVVHDELDLPAGTVRLKRGGGHGGHNGLRDIVAHLGADFWRLRVGIGRPPGSGADVTGHVLSRPGAADEKAIREALDAGACALERMLEVGPQRAMNELHARPAAPAAEDPAR